MPSTPGWIRAWASGDEVYGRTRETRALSEQRGMGCVLAVGSDFRITTDQAPGLVGRHGWNRRSCGNGSRGRRLYGRAWTATASPRRAPRSSRHDEPDGTHFQNTPYAVRRSSARYMASVP